MRLALESQRDEGEYERVYQRNQRDLHAPGHAGEGGDVKVIRQSWQWNSPPKYPISAGKQVGRAGGNGAHQKRESYGMVGAPNQKVPEAAVPERAAGPVRFGPRTNLTTSGRFDAAGQHAGKKSEKSC